MDVKVSPSILSGQVVPPPSKSILHRMIICASLANGKTVIKSISESADINATISAMHELGADIIKENDELIIIGTKFPPKKATIDCQESGSTLRFIIPIAAALGTTTVFKGSGKLPTRPITPYLESFSDNGVLFDYHNTMPFSMAGELQSGVYEIRGDISSQFVTGLLMALPLLDGDSEIKMTSPLESKPYVDITINCLKMFGISIEERENSYFIKGGQQYYSCSELVCEADFSQAAFYYVANALGSNIDICKVNKKSCQGDKKIIEILVEIGYNDNSTNNNELKPFSVDASDIPDLVPILAVLASFCKGKSTIYGAKRLKIKESDRLAAIRDCLNKMGGKVLANDDGLIIEGVLALHGAEISAQNDHRIAMSAAIAALRADGDVIIKGAECVRKSYPNFFSDYTKLGGIVNVINLEQ